MNMLLQIYEPGETPLPHANAVAIGIDLGTTHSVVAIASDAGAEAIHDAHGRAVIPSVVQYTEHYPIVGYDARVALAEGEPDVIGSIKRLMPTPTQTVHAAGKDRTPVEVSADILRHIRSVAEEALGREVTQAVITVPAYFDDTARNATKQAAQLAGLSVLRLINEPTAAALAYGLETQAQGIYAVYDFGGGTFDISILKLQDGIFQVLATAGDTALGGDDIDRAIARYFAEKLGFDKTTLPTHERLKLLALARMKKEKLGEAEDVTLRWHNAEVTLTRATMEALAAPFIDRTLAACEGALQDAKLTVADIQGVVLVGGSTRMALVKEKVAAFFAQTPHDEVSPDLVVAVGAALQAEALTHGSENLLLDVTPLSLGLETYGGIVEKIIHRNSPIPSAVSQDFTTYQDGQTAMAIHVLQGEREKVSDCRSLARFELRGIPPMVAGAARIRVTFSLDADGLLTVAAQEQSTGVQQEIIVTPSEGIAFEDIEAMLKSAMENARSDILERLLIEARVEAERTIAEVTSAMEADAALLKDGEAAMIGMQISTLHRAMEGIKRDRIDHEVAQLNVLIGPFAERRMNHAISSALEGKNVNDVET